MIDGVKTPQSGYTALYLTVIYQLCLKIQQTFTSQTGIPVPCCHIVRDAL